MSTRKDWIGIFTGIPFLVITGSIVLVIGIAVERLLIALILIIAMNAVAWAATSGPDRGLGYHHIQSLAGLTVRVDDQWLIQEDAAGTPLARINLREEHEVSIPHIEDTVSVVRVSQGTEELEFPSTLANAEQIARDHLGFTTWPPRERVPYSF